MEGRNLLFITLCVTVLLPMTTMYSDETFSVMTTPPIKCAVPLKKGACNHVDLKCSAFNEQKKCGNLSLQSCVYNLTCNEEYIYVGPSVYTLHINGSWTPRLPECKRWCEPLKSLTMDIRCEYKGENINCSNPVPVGTVATGRCKIGYLPTEKAANSTTVCNEYGQWNQNLIDCVTPVCGMKNPYEAVYPWVVLIFLDHRRECFGTLISPLIVLTTARCAYSAWSRGVWNTEWIGVILGNVYISSSSEQLKDQEIHVSNISVHPQYTGDDTSYAFNIALMKLETRVLNTPACFDWDRKFQLIPGQLGMSTGSYDGMLIDTYYKYVDYESCRSDLIDRHRRYLTSDKICNEYIKGTPSIGDRGTGFIFERNGLYFVKGVVHHDWFRSDVCGECIAFAMNLSDTGLLNWLKQTMGLLDHDKNNY